MSNVHASASKGEAVSLPFCIPVTWQDSGNHDIWDAYPRLGHTRQLYHCVNVTRCARGDFGADFDAVVDDFGTLTPVSKSWPSWIDTIGQRGHAVGVQ